VSATDTFASWIEEVDVIDVMVVISERSACNGRWTTLLRRGKVEEKQQSGNHGHEDFHG
jgi:hypothetical protein